MSGEITPPGAIEIEIANVELPVKLDAIQAALEAVKQAHVDEMSIKCWREIGEAQAKLSAAMLDWKKPAGHWSERLQIQ